MRARILLMALLVLSIGVARADVVYLKTGGTLEGEIVSETADVVRIKTRLGTVDVDRSRIDRIEHKKTVAQQMREKRAALKADDAEGHFQLARWAEENGLRKDARQLYVKACKIDPKHAGANEALGRVEYGGEWMTPEQRVRRMELDEAVRMRARGLVEHDGKWVTPEVKSKLERGLVEYEGEWLSPDEVKTRQGFVKYHGEWIHKNELAARKDSDKFSTIVGEKLERIDSEHFRVFSLLGGDWGKKVSGAAETAYDHATRILAMPKDESLFGKGDDETRYERPKCRVFLLKNSKQFNSFLDWYGPETGQEDARISLIRRRKGTYNVYPVAYVVGYQFPHPIDQLVAGTIHKIGHVVLIGWRYNGTFPPWWLTIGFGEHLEMAALGRCDTTFETISGYGSANKELAEKWRDSNDWKPMLKSAVASGADPDLAVIRNKDLNELSFDDRAKVWSVVSWMIEEHHESFLRFLALLKESKGQDVAVKAAFGKDWKGIDDAWRLYVRSKY